jgi:acyl transferase domain-containing protein/NAD(P)-dependent dehydrogenase (short-subunit alcohol dehydrogenase family)/SAM-dependent methyltransferase/acyl carrier protein
MNDAAAQATRLERVLDQALARLESERRARSEPIAVIGMACRFPGGAGDPDAFWRLLRDGVDATADVPPDRWDVEATFDADPAALGKMYVRRGGFLPRIADFDAAFFEISPREAASMDPQQRLVLEVAWEALEQAGVSTADLAGSATGVFIGATTNDYGHLLAQEGASALDAYFSTGNALNAIPGRLAYSLGLHGPCLAIDTACSSSLVAVHLACQSLRADECDMAIVGGVNLILVPDVTIAICRARMLAADGRCKTFDAAADGYARGEGCGVVILKRRSDAVAAADRILALIRGSAVNQDGATSGFTVPSGRAQEALIRRALANASVRPTDVGYLEAHGTGTPLGDPIEVLAASAVLAKGRAADRPLVLGSVKTNIGHTEAAAGIAGLIKTVLALQHAEIPPHLHLQTPNPHIPWADLPVAVATARRPWPAGDRPRVAGVSSFGASGTNAHVVLQQSPGDEPVAPPATDRPLHVLALSAKTPVALHQLAQRYAGSLDTHPGSRWPDVCFSANTGRAHHPVRLAVVARTATEAREQLRHLALPDRLHQPSSRTASLKPAFLFTGIDSQFAGIGRELDETQPAFHQALDRCAEILDDIMDRPLRDLLHRSDSGLADAAYAAPALVSLEFALSELWASCGVRPAAVLGHGLGEYVAACVAGVLRLEDVLWLLARRTRNESVDEFVRRAGQIQYRSPELLMVSGLTGERVTEDIATPDYWASHAGPPARLEAGIETLRRYGCDLFIETGLTHSLCEGPSGRDPALLWVSGLRPDEGAWPQFLHSLGKLYERGYSVDWRGFDRGYSRQRVSLPTYPWQRRSYWGRAADRITASPAAPPADDAASVQQQLAQSGEFSQDELKLVPRLLQAVANLRDRTSRAPGDAELLYEVAWRPQALTTTAPADWPEPRTLGARMQGRLLALAPDYATEAYRSVLSDLERLSIDYVAHAWERLGWRFQAGMCCRRADLEARLGVAPRHRRLLERTAEMLCEAGLLRRNGDSWETVAPSASRRPDPVLATLLARCPAAEAECTLLERCAGRLADVLRGVQDPLQLLFPDGDATAASSLYRDAPGARLMNRTLRDGVAEAVARLASGRKLRVLEIGAGTGGTTAGLLEILPADRTDYLFTDISPRFTTSAREQFGAYHFVRYRVLDIERDPTAQNFAEAPFDLIVAANVLHATKDLRQSLRHVRQLAAPGAMLLLLEGTGPIRALDLVFGLTEGWWRFADEEVRSGYPLIASQTWVRLLLQSGFRGAEAVALAPEWSDVLSRQAVIIARADEAAAVDAGHASHSWLILADRGGIGERLASLHAARGGLAALVYQGQAFETAGERAFHIAPDQPEDVRRLIASLDRAAVWGVICLWGLDASAIAGAAETAAADVDVLSCGSILSLLQALMDDRAGLRVAATWLVTRGAVGGAAPIEASSLTQSLLWGLGRTVASEHPDWRSVRVDLDPGASAETCAGLLWDELAARSPEDEVSFRTGTRQVSRLVRHAPEEPATPVRFRQDASYLISGGLGGLGLLTARWLTARGAGTLVLAGRRAADERARQACRELEGMGARVITCHADVGRHEDVRRLLDHIAQCLPPLRGIVHAAGVLDDGMVRQLSRERFARVVEPKAMGAWNLHCLSAGAALDFFVAYSSFTSIAGTPGQSSHAAANAFLDALAWHRRAQGLPALSINWGAWSDIGAAAERQVGRRLAAQGGGTLAPDQALRLLEKVWHAKPAQVAIVPIHWARLESRQARRPMFAEMVSAVPAPASHPTDVHDRLRAASPRRRPALLLEHVCAQTAKVLGMGGAERIQPGQGFFELGMDSLTSVELRNRLRETLGCALPTTVAFDHPTPEALTQFLLGEMKLAPPAEPRPEPARTGPGTQRDAAADASNLSVAELEDLVDELAGPVR